jgi:hypothetical protein
MTAWSPVCSPLDPVAAVQEFCRSLGAEAGRWEPLLCLVEVQLAALRLYLAAEYVTWLTYNIRISSFSSPLRTYGSCSHSGRWTPVVAEAQ